VPGLDHALVLTDDLESTLSFYCDALGLTVASQRPQFPFSGYWLEFDGAVCLHIADRGEYEAHAARLGLVPAAGPLDHLAFGYGDDPALAARLEAAGIAAVRNEVPGAFTQLFVADPNGLRVELNLG
jgi:catechol 2,3-dioxygenase-like lactoylglutathione lyase family enzyme